MFASSKLFYVAFAALFACTMAGYLGGFDGGYGGEVSYGGGDISYGGGHDGGDDGGHDGGHDAHDDYPKYQFHYAVHDAHTGDEKQHVEERDGDQVKGSYTLKEADGTTRIVEYKADKHNGFNAVVHKVGVPVHSEGGHDGVGGGYGGHY